MDMLEKIARAICEDSGCVWDSGDTPARREWLTNARAVLKALLPPTEEMVEAMVHAQVEGRRPSFAAVYTAVFTAGIKAALGKQP